MKEDFYLLINRSKILFRRFETNEKFIR